MESSADFKKQASQILYEASKRTWENRKGRIGEVISSSEDFRGPRGIDISELPKGTRLYGGMDGVGNKIEIAERMKNHRTMASGLVEMVCGDKVREGMEPIFIMSNIDVNSLNGNIGIVKEIVEGYVEAAKEADVVILNGEIAELGKRISGYGNFNYTWCASAIGIGRAERILDGRKIKIGDALVGLEEPGFRSNGLSKLLEIMEKNFGEHWHELSFEGKKKFGEYGLVPAKIYTRAVVEMFGGYDREPKAEIHGIAHITGDGIPEKLSSALNGTGLGAHVEPFEPNDFIKYLQYIGKIDDALAYRTWNMGQGMIIITSEPEKVMNVASFHNIESKIIGEITKNPGITIKSKGYYSEEEELRF
ncbi:hypothetical protein HY449_00880 [Candidatus Pacearchaeota archaeon]|nr:hypothetical protein [Candidatus Pacearchaeota archaeon]